MPEIKIKFAVPQNASLFTWKGNEIEAYAAVGEMRQLAQKVNADPMTFLRSELVGVPTMLVDPNPLIRRHGFNVALAFTVEAETRHPEYPGRFRDYLAVYDFEFIITQLSQYLVSMEVKATARNDGVGVYQLRTKRDDRIGAIRQAGAFKCRLVAAKTVGYLRSRCGQFIASLATATRASDDTCRARDRGPASSS